MYRSQDVVGGKANNPDAYRICTRCESFHRNRFLFEYAMASWNFGFLELPCSGQFNINVFLKMELKFQRAL